MGTSALCKSVHSLLLVHGGMLEDLPVELIVEQFVLYFQLIYLSSILSIQSLLLLRKLLPISDVSIG